MGTVLSFSPRERRPIYSTQHSSFGAGSTGTLSNSNSTDFQLNNYSYEQLNNVKNRENTKPPNLQTVPNHNNHHNNYQSNNNNANNNNLTNITNHHNINNHHGNSLALLGGQTHMNNTNRENNMNNNQERSADTARILSEKNALEKNLKKHSLFINALSWKRLAASHNKKKQLVDNNKNKAANLPTATFRKLSPNEILLKTSYITSSCHSSPVVVYDDVNVTNCYEEDEIEDASNDVAHHNTHTNNKKNKNYFDSSSSHKTSNTTNNSNNNCYSTTTMPILLPLFTQNNSHSSYIENVHPSLVGDKNKNAQQQQHHQQLQTQQTQQNQQSDCNGVGGGQTVYFTPNGPKSLLPIDLMRANNTASLQQTDKLATKIPLHLPLGIQQQQQQQIQHQHGHGPRKTVIQVSGVH